MKIDYIESDVAVLSARKRRVVMVLSHDVLHPSVDPRVYKEAKSLITHGYKVTIVCRVDDTKIERKQRYKGINIVRVLCQHPPLNRSRLIRLMYNFRNVRKLARKIIELQPDIIHCHDLNALLEGTNAARKLNVPLIYDSHEDWPRLEYVINNNSKIIFLLTSIYERILLLRVSYKIMANPGQTRLLTPNDSILLLNCPLKQFMSGASGRTVQKKYKLLNKLVITYHGVVGEKKGIVEIIGAAEKLTRKYKNLIFLIIGNGYEPYEEMVKKKALDKNFIFTGRVQYSEIPSFLKASDIDFSVLKPTIQYVLTTPTKIFEGMAAGIPILGNAEFPGLVDIIQKHQTGILVKYDLDEIIEALEKLIRDKKLRDKLGKNGKQIFNNEYNWENQEEKLIMFYNKICSEFSIP